MKHIGLGDARFILAYILESGGGAIEAVGNYHLVLHKETSHLATLTIGIFCPYRGHSKIPTVEHFLLFG